MEYVQEGITTLHDFGGATPSAPTDRASVVVPMTEREHAGLAAEGVLSALERVDPERVVVPLRATTERIVEVAEWLEDFDLDLQVLWCNAPQLERLLGEVDLNGSHGKGRDVWLGMGIAADSKYVVVHDADAKSYTSDHVPKLLFPLLNGHGFAKGYYARVENDRLYGRLFRLFYRPLVETLATNRQVDVLEYLGAFRYALAGEFALTGTLARTFRIRRGWGLEVGTLGEAFAEAGIDGSAQVDLGMHEHDHRAVSGPSGLSEMAEEVGAAVFHTLETNDVSIEYETLPDRYRHTAARHVSAYEIDAAFNGLEFDRASELEQVETYAEEIAPPIPESLLPAWQDAPIDPDEVVDAATEGLDEARDGR